MFYSRIRPWTSSINIYLNNFFFLSDFTDMCDFVDDTTFYTCNMDFNSLTKRLEHDSFLAIEWFESNNVKFNQNIPRQTKT